MTGVLGAAALFAAARSAPAADVARSPAWRLTIAGKDVTRELTPMVTSVTYNDHATGKSDDVEIVLEDSQGKWRSSWYPTKSDKIELWIGYLGEKLLPCGRFQIDEVEAAGPPDTMTIRALAAGIIPQLRTKRSKAYESQTLKQIAEEVSARHQMKLVGEIEEIHVQRVTQRQEDDLTFLTRLAESYGYVFSVRDDQLIFYEVGSLEKRPPVFTIRRDQVKEYRLKDKSHFVYRSSRVSYEDPKTKKLITRTSEADGVAGGDVLEVNERVEDESQAMAKAKGSLKNANKHQTTGTLSVEGEPRLVAGSTVKLQGFGKLDGVYLAEESVHRATRSEGYVTTPTVKRVS